MGLDTWKEERNVLEPVHKQTERGMDRKRVLKEVIE